MTGILEELGAEARKHWKVTLALIFAVPAYFFRVQMGFSSIPTSFLMYAVLVVFLAVGDSIWGKWRYGTRQYVDLSGHGSVKSPGFYPVGDWAVIPIGSVDTEGFSWEGGQGTRVVPRTSMEILPEFVVSWSRPVPTDLRHLPSEVQSFVEGKRACGRPYYFTTTNLRPAQIEDVYLTVVEQLTGGNPSNPSLKPEALKVKLDEMDAKIKSGMKTIQDEYNKETTRNTDRFTEMQGVITTQQELLADKYRTLAEMADALGTINRALKKAPMLDRFKKKEEES